MAVTDWLTSEITVQPGLIIATIGIAVAVAISLQSSSSSSKTEIESIMKTSSPNDTGNDTSTPSSKKVKFADSNSTKAGASEALRLTMKQGDQHMKHYNAGEDGDVIARKRTPIEEEVLKKVQNAEQIVSTLPKDHLVKHEVDLFLPELLKDAIFVGHLVTDLDSVAGAIGAAELYGGKAALASDVNSETQFALDQWKVDTPPRVEDVLEKDPDMDVCLVDHQQTSQMNPKISADQIVGVIDHHALQSKTIVTDKPIYIDIRPWGSMSTIIAHTFLTHQRRPPVPIAGMLLCAILSDTLNLQGPTTTEWDRLMVAVLADIAGVKDIQFLASQQFKAKSKELANLSAHALVNGDQKTFSFEASGFTGDIGFAVVETTDDDAILDKVADLLPEMVAGKRENNLQCLFLAVVNIVKLKSQLLLCGPTEKALATAAFGGEISEDGMLMDLGKRVSRKKDYIPVITRTIKAGWSRPKDMKRGLSTVSLDKLGTLTVDPNDPMSKVERVGSILQASVSPQMKEFREMMSTRDFGETGDDEKKMETDETLVIG
eukprot:CAMPEP_0203663826 /NCGR_PEP_ID=MMETSP0090-20130426/1358_1 /ASSEMBLY_ACC=CAM_ASM_001088 /TAXON_ID=426623 /ORGANISM="Chaetoceros affinis, Strain CCMP159" /LENGTH=545 /DNA_ID=CAMNT_0050526869 /DNA_START=44 /DNA_END=1681 /DNA_ORIENTATION=-